MPSWSIPRLPACLHGRKGSTCPQLKKQSLCTGCVNGTQAIPYRHLSVGPVMKVSEKYFCSKPLSNVTHVKHVQCLAPCKDSVVHYCDSNGYYNKNNKNHHHSIFIQKYKFCFGMKNDPLDCIMHVRIK